MFDQHALTQVSLDLKSALTAFFVAPEKNSEQLEAAIETFQRVIAENPAVFENSQFVTICSSLNEFLNMASVQALMAHPSPASSQVASAHIASIETLLHILNSPAPDTNTTLTQSPSTHGSETSQNFAVMRVYFATDRNRASSKTPTKAFGSERAEVSYGTCDISIPRDHRMGHIETPSIWRFEFRENPEKHVVLMDVASESKDDFFAAIAERVNQFPKSCAFIFIHGYNVTFADAAKRTAQMAYDLAFEGAPVFYSWPSQGKTAAYTVDENNVKWSENNLKVFLEDFLTRSTAEHIYLIAHSMGNRALTGAITTLLRENPAAKDRLKEIILTAPDIDAEIFKRDIAPALSALACPTTLYASSKDLALAASKKIHGAPRVGDAGANLVICDGIETVDASHVDTSLLGHSYFAETASVLSDIFYLIREGNSADQRFALQRIRISSGVYWEFKP